MLSLPTMPALPEAEAALGETAVAASAAEPIAAVRKKSLLVLNSYSSNPSQRVARCALRVARYSCETR
jgi:hypothetical protein